MYSRASSIYRVRRWIWDALVLQPDERLFGDHERVLSAHGPGEERPRNDEGPNASAQGRRPQGIAETRADE